MVVIVVIGGVAIVGVAIVVGGVVVTCIVTVPTLLAFRVPVRWFVVIVAIVFRVEIARGVVRRSCAFGLCFTPAFRSNTFGFDVVVIITFVVVVVRVSSLAFTPHFIAGDIK